MTFLQNHLTPTWAGVNVPSTFPIERRPIYVHPVAAMSRKNEEHARPLIADAISKVIARYPTYRILIHTVSYSLNNFLEGSLRASSRKRIVTYHSAGEKQRAIDTYLNRTNGIFLAPSLDRGIDLPGDDCRVIIICKIPFPSLGDKQVSARMYSKGGRQWYAVRTIRSLVQMTGRGMRSTDDYCESYILDKNFLDMVWHRNRNLLPKWWTDALVWNQPTL
jgi:Rad3-related DNA helicase